MKKICSILIMILAIFTFNKGVLAENVGATEDQENFSELKSKFENAQNNQQTLSGSGYVTFYGHSVCNGTSSPDTLCLNIVI